MWGEGGRVYGNSLYFQLNFAVNLKLIYKIKSIKKNPEGDKSLNANSNCLQMMRLSMALSALSTFSPSLPAWAHAVLQASNTLTLLCPGEQYLLNP